MARNKRESGRGRSEEINVEKFVVRHGEAVLADAPTEVVGYGRDGLVTPDPDAAGCLCKEVRSPDTGTTRCFVKFALLGPHAGRMVDHLDQLDLGKGGDWTASGRFGFRAVTRAAFDFYLRFVKTGNRAYLRQAEREIDL